MFAVLGQPSLLHLHILFLQHTETPKHFAGFATLSFGGLAGGSKRVIL